MPSGPPIPLRGPDGVGVGLAAGLAGWILAAGGPTAASLVAAVVALSAAAAVVLAGRLTAVDDRVVPAVVAGLPVSLLAAVPGGLAVHGPLGYANASAALVYLGAAGALLLGVRADRRATRAAAGGLYAVYAVLPWLAGAYAAGVLVVLLGAGLAVAGRRRGRIVLGAAAAVVVAAVALTVGVGGLHAAGAPVPERGIGAALSTTRVQLWSEAAGVAARHPVAGAGPGRLPTVSPTAGADEGLRWAHNEYLELAAEAGVPAGLLLLGLVLWAPWRAAVGSVDRGAVIAGLAVAGLGVHASIDYVLHFPLVVLAAAALVGTAADPPDPRGVPRGTSARAMRAHPGPRLPVPVARAALGTWALVVVLLVPAGPLNPPHLVDNGAHRTAGGGLRFDAPGVVHSEAPPHRLYERVAASGEFTLAVRARAARARQHGPARLVTLSGGTGDRNLTLGQDGTAAIVRLRTRPGDHNARDNRLRAPGALGDGRWHDLVVTYDGTVVSLSVDGRIRASARTTGGLGAWDRGHPLVLGNEVGLSRPWRGSLDAVLIRDEAVGPDRMARVLRGAAPGTGLEGELRRPGVIPAPPPGLPAVAIDLAQHRPLTGWGTPGEVWAGHTGRLVRPSGTLVLGTGWAVLTVRTGRGRRRPRPAAALAVGLGVALAAGVEALQYLQGRSPSVVDVLAVGAGALLGAVVAARRPGTPVSGVPVGDGPCSSRVADQGRVP